MSDVLGGATSAESARELKHDAAREKAADASAEAIKSGLAFDDDPIGPDTFPGQELEDDASPLGPSSAEPEYEAAPEPPPAQAKPTDDELEEKRRKIREKYGIEEGADSLVDAHVHLQQSYGRQTGELGDYRSRFDRLEGKLEALTGGATAPAAPGRPLAARQPVTPRTDANARWRTGVAHLSREFEARGYEPKEARDMAEAALTASSHVIEGTIEEKLGPILDRQRAEERVEQLFAAATRLKDERDAEGNPVRPDWDQVINSREFAQIVDLKRPETLNPLYTTDGAGELTPDGVELAYLRAKARMGGRLQETSTAASAAAEASVEREKLAAGSVSSAPAARVAVDTDDLEAEIFQTAKGGSNGHFLMTGRFPA